MRYAMDTNHASRFLREDARLRSRVSLASELGAEIYLPTPVVAELYFMVFNSAQVLPNLEALASVANRYVHLDFDVFAAMQFGKIRANLRRLGQPIPVMDVQIASVAYVNDLTLLSADEHFSRVEGLRVENWL